MMRKVMMKQILCTVFAVYSFVAFGEQASKQLCQPVDQAYLEQHFRTKHISHIEFLDLVNSRREIVKKGDKIKSYVLADKYRYASVDEGIKLYKMANGLESETFKSSREISLPFCANNNERNLAAIGNVEVDLENSAAQDNKKLTFSISAQYGNLEVKNSSEKYSMNFIKVSGNSNYKISDKYFVSSTLSVVQFRNIEHSETDSSVDGSDPYPEFGTTLFMRKGRANFGIGYDFLQYFVRDASVKGVSLTPSATHRISPKFSYSLSDNVTLIGSLGLLQSFEENNVSGFDAVLGASFSLDKRKKLVLTPIFYKGVVERDSSSKSDDSTVIAATLSYRF
jgi:hypothetical protein